MFIKIEAKGSFGKTELFAKSLLKMNVMSMLHYYAQQGVDALARATPISSGLAANSWTYEVVQEGRTYSIHWNNFDIENGFPVVVMLQYGYGTGTGGYVQGRDFINPAIKPVFDLIAENVWKVVTSA